MTYEQINILDSAISQFDTAYKGFVWFWETYFEKPGDVPGMEKKIPAYEWSVMHLQLDMIHDLLGNALTALEGVRGSSCGYLAEVFHVLSEANPPPVQAERGMWLQTSVNRDKLGVKRGRYVCPVCRHRLDQAVHTDTNAENLHLWCRQCKSDHLVNIVNGEGFVVCRIR